jgi:hypothetical protein
VVCALAGWAGKDHDAIHSGTRIRIDCTAVILETVSGFLFITNKLPEATYFDKTLDLLITFDPCMIFRVFDEEAQASENPIHGLRRGPTIF